MTAPRGARSFVAMSRKTIILAAAATCAGRAAAIVGTAGAHGLWAGTAGT